MNMEDPSRAPKAHPQIHRIILGQAWMDGLNGLAGLDGLEDLASKDPPRFH